MKITETLRSCRRSQAPMNQREKAGLRLSMLDGAGMCANGAPSDQSWPRLSAHRCGTPVVGGRDVALNRIRPKSASAGASRAASTQSAEQGLHAGQGVVYRGIVRRNSVETLSPRNPGYIAGMFDPSHRGLRAMRASSDSRTLVVMLLSCDCVQSCGRVLQSARAGSTGCSSHQMRQRAF